MFKSILVPVDLAHEDTLGMTLQCAADLARMHGAKVCYLGATTATPSKMGHTPEEFGKKLEAFANAQAKTHGHTATHKVVIAHDPTTDIDDTLLQAVKDSGADLVVMASHKPGLADYIWPSNGGKIAAHAEASVFLVRG